MRRGISWSKALFVFTPPTSEGVWGHSNPRPSRAHTHTHLDTQGQSPLTYYISRERADVCRCVCVFMCITVAAGCFWQWCVLSPLLKTDAGMKEMGDETRAEIPAKTPYSSLSPTPPSLFYLTRFLSFYLFLSDPGYIACSFIFCSVARSYIIHRQCSARRRQLAEVTRHWTEGGRWRLGRKMKSYTHTDSHIHTRTRPSARAASVAPRARLYIRYSLNSLSGSRPLVLSLLSSLCHPRRRGE